MTRQATPGTQSGVTLTNWADADVVPRAPSADGLYEMPGMGRIPARLPLGQTKFLGSGDGDRVGPPWLYLFQRPEGEVTPWRRHTTDHLELVLSGQIEWFDEERRDGVELRPGGVMFVPAGHSYRYTTRTPADLLALWYGAPDVIADTTPHLVSDMRTTEE